VAIVRILLEAVRNLLETVRNIFEFEAVRNIFEFETVRNLLYGVRNLLRDQALHLRYLSTKWGPIRRKKLMWRHQK
jgi:hypothetical protein